VAVVLERLRGRPLNPARAPVRIRTLRGLSQYKQESCQSALNANLEVDGITATTVLPANRLPYATEPVQQRVIERVRSNACQIEGQTIFME